MPEGVKHNRFHPDDRVRATLSTCGRGAYTYLQQIPGEQFSVGQCARRRENRRCKRTRDCTKVASEPLNRRQSRFSGMQPAHEDDHQ
jgi:hypothetical protein